MSSTTTATPAAAVPQAKPHAGPDPGRATRPSRRRLRAFVAVETVVIALGIAFLVFGRAGFAGSPISYVVVSGHSMEPTFHTGDVVVLRRTGSYAKGDVIGPDYVVYVWSAGKYREIKG